MRPVFSSETLELYKSLTYLLKCTHRLFENYVQDELKPWCDALATDNQADRGVSSVSGTDPDDASPITGAHCCLVAIGRLQVTSCPNTSDLTSSSSSTEFISRHSIDGKFTFVDHRFVILYTYSLYSVCFTRCIAWEHRRAWFPGRVFWFYS